MLRSDRLIFETDTRYGHYQVWDLVYSGRPARVLYSGQRQSAQSGVALDTESDLLFEYNQRLYELVCGILPKKILLIGGGAYTLPMALLKTLNSLLIDVIEIDGDLLPIASRFFGLQSDARLNIIHREGLDFLSDYVGRESYDMILLDAFLDSSSPSSLSSISAIEMCRKNLKPDGIVAVNIIGVFNGPGGVQMRQLINRYRTIFKAVDLFPANPKWSLWLSQNFILVAQAGKYHPIDGLLRYAAVDS